MAYVMEAKQIAYTYEDGTQALKEVSIQIEKGKTTALLGGNGAGKSTLLLMLNGILKPQGGQCFFENQPIDYEKKTLKHLRKNVAIVFQDPDVQLFSANVFQDISFGPMNLGLPKEEVIKRVQKAMIQTGIEEIQHKPTHALSFGQKKRVAIAGVLAMEPQVLILDEPTAGLDPKGVQEIMGLLRTLQASLHLSVIISTHDIDMVPQYCDYVYAMDRGKIVLSGTPKAVFEQKKALEAIGLRLPEIGKLMYDLKCETGVSDLPMAYTVSEAKDILNQRIQKNTKP